MFDQIADGNNPDHFTVLDHREVTNVFLGHQAQTFINAFSGLRCRNVRRHDFINPGLLGRFAADKNFPGVIAFRDNSD